MVRDHLQAGRLRSVDLDWSFKVTFAAIATRAASYSPMVSRIVGYAATLGQALQEEESPGASAPLQSGGAPA